MSQGTARKVTECRACGSARLHNVLSLGNTPIANDLPRPSDPTPDPSYPLGIVMCRDCSLVQLGDDLPADAIFNDDYPYFSSFSESLCAHAAAHVDSLLATRDLGPSSLVVEIASNDGYLLRNFVKAGVPVLGIDPAPGPAAAAEKVGVPTLVEFFGEVAGARLRAERGAADVIIANNVLAHVPQLNDVVAGFAALLADDGVITIENPSVRTMIENLVFDTIYHEHYCYFSCTAIDKLMRRHGLFLNDVEYLPSIHGGSLRWSVQKFDAPTERCTQQLRAESEAGMSSPEYYDSFAQRVRAAGAQVRTMLAKLRSEGATIAAYGAAAKGATLLNSQGIGADLIDYVVDANPHKQGRAIPGVRIPIVPPERLGQNRPDYLLLLAWNYKDEIRRQQAAYLAAGGRFIVPLPVPTVES
jgi:SAM-dependent methyltransferase